MEEFTDSENNFYASLPYKCFDIDLDEKKKSRYQIWVENLCHDSREAYETAGMITLADAQKEK
jgi:hypothetical protein